MSAVVKLSSALPGDFEVNGLDQHQEDLVERPAESRCALIWFDCVKVVVDTDTGDQVPTVRIRRIEPLGDADDVSRTVRQEVAKAEEARTGKRPLPWDVVEVSEHRYSDTLEDSGDDA